VTTPPPGAGAIATSCVSSVRLWSDYTAAEKLGDEPAQRNIASHIHRPGWWWAAHASTGLVALCVAVSLMSVRRPPSHPLYWMRLSLTILLVVIFLATTARHMRLAHSESERARLSGGGRE